MKTKAINHVQSGTKKSFWQTLAAFYGRALPLSFLELKCTTVRDAKYITGVLLVGLGILFIPFLIPASIVMFSAITHQEGGHK